MTAARVRAILAGEVPSVSPQELEAAFARAAEILAARRRKRRREYVRARNDGLSQVARAGGPGSPNHSAGEIQTNTFDAHF